MSAGPQPMNGLRHGGGLALTPRYPSGVPVPSLSGIEVRWRVSRRSLGTHAPEGNSSVVDMVIALRMRGVAGAICEITATDPATGPAVGPTAGPVSVLRTLECVAVEVIDDIRSEIHVEAPGVLSVTVVPDGAGGWRLLYARTPLLADLGIPGGRAEPAGVRVEA